MVDYNSILEPLILPLGFKDTSELNLLSLSGNLYGEVACKINEYSFDSIVNNSVKTLLLSNTRCVVDAPGSFMALVRSLIHLDMSTNRLKNNDFQVTQITVNKCMSIFTILFVGYR